MKQVAERGRGNPMARPAGAARRGRQRSSAPGVHADAAEAAPLRALVRQARERLDAAGAAIVLVESAALRVAAAAGTLEPLDGRVYGPDGSVTERVLRAGAPVVVNDIAVEPPATGPMLEFAGATRVLATPASFATGRGAALLVVAGDCRQPFAAADVETAQRLAGQASCAVQNAILDRELRDREEALRRMSADLRAAVRAKHRFFAWSSHELRTPLNAALCYNDLLIMGVLGPLTERQRSAAERMGAAIRRLCRLVEGLFELGELEGGDATLNVTAIDLRALADRVVAEMGPHAAERGVCLSVAAAADAPSPAVETDGAKVHRVLLLLCADALTFTTRGGVTIRLRHRSGGARIEVADTGCDIARRGDWLGHGAAQPAPDREQAGLGPAIAHRLAALLGGRIALRPRPGGGAITALHLPPRPPVL